jgi:tetratricopeptide (TPR) repeat protein
VSLRPAVLFFSLLAPLLASGVTAPTAQDAGENQFDANITLFSVMAAINTAGFDAGINAPINARFQVRDQVRAELAKRTIPCLPELKAFYLQHKKPTETADLSQYISFALLADGPPDFPIHSVDLPEDVAALHGFGELLARFYKEANLAEFWNRSQPAYNRALGEFQPPVLKAVVEANAYARNPSGVSAGRRFQIYFDLLGAPDQIQIRSYRRDYYVVLTPTVAPIEDEIRDAYLAYILDPLSLRYSNVLMEKKKGLQKFVDNAPALDLAYKDDFSLLVTKCLIKAIDSRLMKNEAKRQLYVDQAVREGFILTAAFADLLVGYEKQDVALRLYYPDLIAAIDVGKEQKRLRKVEFAETVSRPAVIVPAQVIQISQAERTLASAEGLFEQKDYENAKKAYSKALSETADKPLHGRSYYGLARIALVEKHYSEAAELFQRVLDNDPNPSAVSWSHYYLGRIALSSGDNDKAKDQFQAVLKTEGASVQAREATTKILQEISGEKDQ